MSFLAFEPSAVSRVFGRLGAGPQTRIEAFFERSEVDLLREPSAGTQRWREEGFALRCIEGKNEHLHSSDDLSRESFETACRRVLPFQPRVPVVGPELAPSDWEESDEDRTMETFAARLRRAVELQRVGFPFELALRRHRRQVLVVLPSVLGDVSEERYFSFEIRVPWGRSGGLLPDLERPSVESLADNLVEGFRSREAPPPSSAKRRRVVLGPAASAILLHEVVAHALEADTLAQSGDPDHAIGVTLGPSFLDVLDDPAGGPVQTSRHHDDEGTPVLRRWLLRAGRVEQPLSDLFFAERSARLLPGGGRRATRHDPPAPRSSHLELLSGECALDELLEQAVDGVYVPAFERGRLDSRSGLCSLWAPHARRITSQGLADRLGPCRLTGSVTELLSAVVAVGRDAVNCGAGWCAKSRQKLPVWATCAELALDGVVLGP